MPTSGDVVDIDFGTPQGHEAGLIRPAVVITAQQVLDQHPHIVQVVPLTTTLRAFEFELHVLPDPTNGLDEVSAAQCQHIRSVSRDRIVTTRGNVGATGLRQLRETVALILDMD